MARADAGAGHRLLQPPGIGAHAQWAWQAGSSCWDALPLLIAPPPLPPSHFSPHPQELVRDDNRRNAVLSLDLHNMPSTYKHNTPEAYYQCRLLSLQWWRSSNQLRYVTAWPSACLVLWLPAAGGCCAPSY